MSVAGSISMSGEGDPDVDALCCENEVDDPVASRKAAGWQPNPIYLDTFGTIHRFHRSPSWIDIHV
jgi:hypothetical protein